MSDKLQILLKQDKKIFHTQDLAVLWNLHNTNTLHTTIKRYRHRGILYPIFKGMYSTIPISELQPLILGLKAMHHFAYISCETVLAQRGMINQVIEVITIVGHRSCRFTVAGHSFRSRKLKDGFLYNPTGIQKKGELIIATTERAIADLLYYHPHAHLDVPIDWEAIRRLQNKIGYPITQRL